MDEITDVPVIEMCVDYRFPGQFPGQLGYSNHVFIRFFDLGGKFSALDRRQKRITTLLERAQDRAFESRGFRRRFWSHRYGRLEKKLTKLTNRARMLANDMLLGEPSMHGLEASHLPPTEPFEPVTTRYKAEELRGDLGIADHIRFKVLSAA